jgi:hypothetical protein
MPYRAYQMLDTGDQKDPVPSGRVLSKKAFTPLATRNSAEPEELLE